MTSDFFFFFYCNVSGSFTDEMNIQYFQFLATALFKVLLNSQFWDCTEYRTVWFVVWGCSLVFYLVVGLFFTWKNQYPGEVSWCNHLLIAGELRHRKEDAHGLYENICGFSVVRSKRPDHQAYYPAWCISRAAQSLEGSPAISLDIPVAAELVLVSGWVCVGREVSWHLWLEEHLLPGMGNGNRNSAWSLQSHSGASCGQLDFQRIVLEALRSTYSGCENWLCVEVSLIRMFWEEQVACLIITMLNQVMIIANLQSFHQSMRVINSFK